MERKETLIERFQQLAGIKPLYTEQLGPRMSNPRPTGPSDDRRPKDIEFDNAQAMDRLTPDDRDKMGKIQQMMQGEKNYKKAEFVYSEGNGQFYSLNLYTSDGQKTKLGLTQYDEANEWVKEQLEYIHEGDLIPRHYGSGLEDLNLIVDRLKELGIEASHNEYDFS